MSARGINWLTVATVAVIAVAVAGCGSKPGAATVKPEHGATLAVTRDFGATELLPARTTEVTGGLTAMRQLEAAAKVETSFGGRYVTSIDDLKQDLSQGYDWLFYLDGIESDVGAASVKPAAGQVVQWDHHRWRDVKTGGAIVGAFPLPLRRDGVALECLPRNVTACELVKQRMRAARVPLNGKGVALKVGTWNELARLDLSVDLASDPAGNGAFAAFPGDGKLQLAADAGSVARTLGPGSGLVTAFAEGDEIQWLVTGVDTRGVERAAGALEAKQLAHRFAVAVDDSGAIALPLRGEGAGE